MRYIAFPSADHRIPLSFAAFVPDTVKIIAGPTESGLYLLETDHKTAALLTEALADYYLVLPERETE